MPIFGDVETEISLELVFQKFEPVFELSGKSLKLLKPLDRDKDNLSHIVFQVCVRRFFVVVFHNLSIVLKDSNECGFFTDSNVLLITDFLHRDSIASQSQHSNYRSRLRWAKILFTSHFLFKLFLIMHIFSRRSFSPFFLADVNDNAPVFVNTPYEVTVPEVSWFISRCELITSVVKQNFISDFDSLMTTNNAFMSIKIHGVDISKRWIH